MRLINVQTRQLEEFFESDTPPYAILSHCWGEDEVSYKEFSESGRGWEASPRFEKLRGLLEIAGENSIDYVWIDTCCIDKRSSAELSEAINSMFRWYRNAEVCYALLSDVTDTRESISDVTFTQSRWFTRGWTLQELIAPKSMVFFDKDWNIIATRNAAATQISGRTGIDIDILQDNRGDLSARLRTFSVAQRMSWAANRRTRREEDRAYSLLGLFQVNMPLLYGEGTKAYERLQHEIMKQVAELSILAWSHRPPSGLHENIQLLASDPDDFAECGNLVWDREIDGANTEGDISPSNRGIRVTAPVMIVTDEKTQQSRLAMLLSCKNANAFTTTAALKLYMWEGAETGYFVNPLERQLSVCVRGWTQSYKEQNVIFVDTIDAADQAKMMDVEIRGYSIAMIRSINLVTHKSGQYTTLWIRFNDPTNRRAWSNIDFHPKQYWHPQNRTFDLVGARNDAIAAAEASCSTTPESELGFPVIGGMALRKDSTEMSIVFSQHSASLIVFGIVPYDKDDLDNLRVQLGDPEHSCRFGNNRMVKVEQRLHGAGNDLVVVLAIDIFEGQSSESTPFEVNEVPSRSNALTRGINLVDKVRANSQGRISLLNKFKSSRLRSNDMKQ